MLIICLYIWVNNKKNTMKLNTRELNIIIKALKRLEALDEPTAWSPSTHELDIIECKMLKELTNKIKDHEKNTI